MLMLHKYTKHTETHWGSEKKITIQHCRFSEQTCLSGIRIVITDGGQTTILTPPLWIFPIPSNLSDSPACLTIRLPPTLQKTHLSPQWRCVIFWTNSPLNLKKKESVFRYNRVPISKRKPKKMGMKATIYHLSCGIWMHQENQQDSCAANQSAVVSVLPNNTISPLLILNASL